MTYSSTNTLEELMECLFLSPNNLLITNLLSSISSLGGLGFGIQVQIMLTGGTWFWNSVGGCFSNLVVVFEVPSKMWLGWRCGPTTCGLNVGREELDSMH